MLLEGFLLQFALFCLILPSFCPPATAHQRGDPRHQRAPALMRAGHHVCTRPAHLTERTCLLVPAGLRLPEPASLSLLACAGLMPCACQCLPLLDPLQAASAPATARTDAGLHCTGKHSCTRSDRGHLQGPPVRR